MTRNQIDPDSLLDILPDPFNLVTVRRHCQWKTKAQCAGFIGKWHNLGLIRRDGSGGWTKVASDSSMTADAGRTSSALPPEESLPGLQEPATDPEPEIPGCVCCQWPYATPPVVARSR